MSGVKQALEMLTDELTGSVEHQPEGVTGDPVGGLGYWWRLELRYPKVVTVLRFDDHDTAIHYTEHPYCDVWDMSRLQTWDEMWFAVLELVMELWEVDA